MRTASAVLLTAATLLLFAAPATARDHESEEACRDAARALVDQDTRWNNRRGGASGKSQSTDTIYWLAKDGTEGVCRVDRRGRVYEVRVEHWGEEGDITTWPGEDDYEERELVRCESDRRKQRDCPIPRGAEVRLFDQLSDTPCVYGDNWGYSRDEIWVDDGCRAVFEVTW